MSRRVASASPMLVELDVEASEPLYRQLYRELRTAILDGRLAPGVRVPSTRTLATDLNVSRNTVLTAFDQLVAEGYLEGRVGAGTRVSRALPDHALRTRNHAQRSRRLTSGKRSASRSGIALAATPLKASQAAEPAPHAFRPGCPAYDEFPVALWARLTARRWRRSATDLLDYGPPAGYLPLRQAIASYVRVARGVSCEAEQVLVVAGSQQALDLSARVLLDPGDVVWLEDPGYHGARGAFTAAGACIAHVPVDGEGLDVRAGAARFPAARLVYVTPSHQFPLGVTMSLARRLQLLRWASGAGSWVLEDDYDSEFRYTSRPLSALQGLDTDGRVIYVGTFSKTLFPSLRLGYVIVPPDLVEICLATRYCTSGHCPSLEQAVLVDFMNEGHFERHIRRMRSLYQERQEILIDAARRELAGLLDVQAAEAGMHVVGWLPAGMDDVHISRVAATRDVDVIPLSFFSNAPLPRGGLLLGYAGVAEREIRAGVLRLRGALRTAIST